MSHTNLDQHRGYSIHGTSEKHDNGKWVGSFHISQGNAPIISISALDDMFDTAEAAAAYALRQARLYIDRELK